MTRLSRRCLFLTGVIVLGLSLPAQTSKVIPASAAKTEGSRNSVYPYAYTASRFHQVWAGSAITSSVAFIDGMDYRANAPRSTAIAGRTIPSIQIDFGSTSVTPTSLSLTFASNITSAMTTVFSGSSASSRISSMR